MQNEANSFGFSMLPVKKMLSLTHISLASFLWDIGKQYSPRSDTAKRSILSGAIPLAEGNFIDLEIN